MKNFLTAPFSLAIALSIASIGASGQVRPNKGIRGPAPIDAQIRRNNRLPGQRGVNRPPFGVGQQGRNGPLNPNQMKKQELQRRVMQAIGLRPEQRMRMQEIRRSHEDELIGAGRRLRQARQALDRAIMSEPYSEAEVRRATEELAAAQADKVRLDANVRSQVRNVLTPDQVQRFHQLQREMRREMKEQQQEQEKEKKPQGISNVTMPDENDLAELLLSISTIK
jgi:Spy/CpxP family protein refolding chaperone